MRCTIAGGPGTAYEMNGVVSDRGSSYGPDVTVVWSE